MAFEADHFDERTQSGWSVLVNGRAWAIYDDGEIQRLNHLGLHPWVQPETRPFWIRIRPARSADGRRRELATAGGREVDTGSWCAPIAPRRTS